MKVPVYNAKGETTKELELPESVFGVVIKPEVVKQVVVAWMANQRNTVAHAKDRSEVRGGGKKPWKQKGTGRARHGSIRSPLWIGGGVTFGPTNQRNFKKKVNKKVRRLAMKMMLSQKVTDQLFVVVDSLEQSEVKTKLFVAQLKELPTKGTVLVVLDAPNELIAKSAANVPGVEVALASTINAGMIAKYTTVVITDTAVAALINMFE